LFEKTGNPVYAIEAFLCARQMRGAPPENVLVWFTACLQEWHSAQGKKSIDRIMKLRRPGQTPPYKALLLEDRNEKLFQKIAILKSLGLKSEDAAEMVSRGHEEARNRNISKWRLGTLSADSLHQAYKRWTGRHLLEEYCEEKLPTWSHEQLRKFLSLFPADSVSGSAREKIRKLIAYVAEPKV
jgi:hypothetical protein